ncbi:fibronectin type III domain-containing protein [Pedobacter glucosidilyticus]|uniref:fibronectin type III domain-containing protein n=1 Tax=Pedobacter glucosidilyticus TaxID=1122941 RepID=UPI0003F6A713|nr:fibronectin type III domain-containing protein [Pedobacter glucosidilyticus]
MKIKLLLVILCLASICKAQTPTETFNVVTELSIPTHPTNGTDFPTSIVSHKGSIYYAYIDPSLNGCIAKKDPNGVVTSAVVLPGIQNNPSHTMVGIAIDAEGYIHYIGNMHQNPMVYLRSDKPEDITAFTSLNGDVANGGMWGPVGVTYGRFVQSRKGTLFFLSRQRLNTVNEGWVQGIMGGHIQVYNTDTKRWTQLGSLNYSMVSDRGQTITGGMDSQHQTRAVIWDNSGAGAFPGPIGNAYQGYKLRVVFDKNNRMHMVWNVAKNPVLTTVSDTHTHLMYAYSDDEGVTWRKSDGSLLTLPIGTTNGEVVYSEDPNVNTQRMYNFCNIMLTADNRPVLLQFSYTQNKTLAFKFNGTTWEEVSGTWNPSWPGEGLIDDNGYMSLVSGSGGGMRRSNDNGTSWRQYTGVSTYPGAISFDYEYYRETGILRLQSANGGTLSEVRTVTFSNASEGQLVPPVFSVLSGSTFNAAQSVSITHPTADVVIRYTTDGSLPTETNGTVYTAPITLNNTTTIKAVAFKTGRLSSRFAASRILVFIGPDTQAPSAPTNLSPTNISSRGFTVNWTASVDDRTINPTYEVYLNNTMVGVSTSTSYIFNNLDAGTNYSVTIKGKDAAGNVSAFSNVLSVSTLSSNAIGIFTSRLDIGGASPAGSSTFNNGTYTINGAGNTNATNEASQYLFRDVTGDFVLTGRVQSYTFDNNVANIFGRAGFMVRQGTQANNPPGLYLACFNSANGIEWRTRATQSANFIQANVVYSKLLPHWIRLTRTGNSFRAEYSEDGSAWTVLGNQTVVLESTVQVGLFVASNLNALRSATFTNVSITTPNAVADNVAPSAATNIFGSEITTNSFKVNWTAATDNVATTAYDVLINDNYVGTTTSTSFTVTGLTLGTGYNVIVRAKDAAGNTTPSAPVNIATRSNDASVDKTSSAIVVDGVKESSWAGVTLPIAKVTTGTVSGAADLSGTWQANYDATNLYIFADVTDDAINTTSSNWYENDGIEIYIDATNAKSASYTSSTFQLTFTHGNAVLTSRNGASRPVTGVELAFVNKAAGGGYVVEIKIPLASLAIPTPVANGQKLGFDISLIDNDTGFRKGKMSWFNNQDNSWQSPANFGIVTFSEVSDNQAPTVPTGLVSSNITATGFKLDWTASTDNIGVASYEVFRNGVSLGTTTQTTFNVTGLLGSTTYSMTVLAKDEAGNASAQSTVLSVTTLAPPDTEAPTSPIGLAFSNVTETSAVINWSPSLDNVGVTAYEIFVNGTSVGTTSITNFEVTGLTAGTTYNITVRARDAAGNNSSASPALVVATLAAPDTQAPSVPTGLAFNTLTNTSFNITWMASTDNVGVTSYEIFNNGVSAGTATSTSFSLTGLNALTAYSITIKAKDATNNISAESAALVVNTLAAPDVQAPTVPTALSFANLTFNGFTLNWTASTDNIGVSSYEIFRNGSLIGSSTTTSFVVSGLDGSTTYSLTVLAKDVAGNSSAQSTALSVTTPAAPDTQAPTVPTGLASSNLTFNSFTLSWTASTDNVGVTSYEIFRNGASIGTSTTTSIVLNGLTELTNYSMTVVAKDLAGNVSSQSAPLVVRTLAAPDTQAPTVPTNLASSNITVTGFTLTWSASTDNVGVVSYEVFRNGTSIGTSTASSFALTGLSPATSYALTVLAKDAAGNASAQSAVLNVTTSAGDIQAPTVPTELIASNINSAGFSVSWKPSSDNVAVTSYTVYVNGQVYGNTASNTIFIKDLSPNTTYTITVAAADAAGNVSAQSTGLAVKTLTFSTNNLDVVVANLLSPNGDNINDVWMIENIHLYPNHQIKVFDSLGRVMLDKRSYQNDWNGTINGNLLNPGAYLYIIDLGNNKTLKGFITIVY